MNIYDRDVLTLIARKIMEGDDFDTALSFYSTSKTTMQICENIPRWIKFKKIRQMLQSMENSKNIYSKILGDELYLIDHILYRGLKGDDLYLIYNASSGKGHIVKGNFNIYLNSGHYHFRKNLDGYGDFLMISKDPNIVFKNKKIFLSLTINAMHDTISVVAKETRDEAISECIKCARYSQYAEYEKESLRKKLEVGNRAYYSLSTLRIIEVDVDV